MLEMATHSKIKPALPRLKETGSSLHIQTQLQVLTLYFILIWIKCGDVCALMVPILQIRELWLRK